MPWQAYLSGEIHSDWRERIEDGAAAAGLDIAFGAPVTDHAASDVVVVRFGEQYRQCNAAFDAGYAAALGKPLVVLHPEQVVEILKYALQGVHSG